SRRVAPLSPRWAGRPGRARVAGAVTRRSANAWPPGRRPPAPPPAEPPAWPFAGTPGLPRVPARVTAEGEGVRRRGRAVVPAQQRRHAVGHVHGSVVDHGDAS